VPGKGGLVKGGTRESVVAPLWRDENSLYLISDWPGWWNVYQASLTGDSPHALYPAEEEFAEPLWQLGARPYALLSDGRLAVLHGVGGMRLGVLDPATGELTDLDIPYRVFAPGLSADGMSVVAVAGGPSTALSVIQVDMAAGKAKKLSRPTGRLPAAGYLPKPRRLTVEGRFGQTVHALAYPPTSPDAVPLKKERPPYVVWAHGGPTGHANRLLDLEKAYFTSRGIGVIDVNYGGSSGYGRSYRERLHLQWGVVDADDVMSAARALVEAGEADGARLAVRGGSAGGWTALTAVTVRATEPPVFSAATSYCGISDPLAAAKVTHDFESHYDDTLLGPLPAFAAKYAERAPIGHVTAATCPVLLLQGMEDPVVPPAQTESMAAELAAHGVRHAVVAFEGEGHGFRRAESITAALEAELSFYGQVMGFTPPGIPELKLEAGQVADPPGAGPEPPPEPPAAGRGAGPGPGQPEVSERTQSPATHARR
jgi:dipeptidyl aminopeptidase/acylaminoacyl peptidase